MTDSEKKGHDHDSVRDEDDEISLHRLPPEAWHQYGKQILAIDHALFPQSLAQPEEELKDTFTDPQAIFITALDKEEVVGFISGEIVHYYVEPGDPEYDLALANSIYVETLDVKETAQGKGIGRKLLQEFVAVVRGLGYEYLVGHWREGASQRLIQSCGGEIRYKEENYFETGETYYYITLKL